MEEAGIRYVGIDLAKRTFVARIEYPDATKAEVFQGRIDVASRLFARQYPCLHLSWFGRKLPATNTHRYDALAPTVARS